MQSVCALLYYLELSGCAHIFQHYLINGTFFEVLEHNNVYVEFLDICSKCFSF